MGVGAASSRTHVASGSAFDDERPKKVLRIKGESETPFCVVS